MSFVWIKQNGQWIAQLWDDELKTCRYQPKYEFIKQVESNDPKDLDQLISKYPHPKDVEE